VVDWFRSGLAQRYGEPRRALSILRVARSWASLMLVFPRSTAGQALGLGVAVLFGGAACGRLGFEPASARGDDERLVVPGLDGAASERDADGGGLDVGVGPSAEGPPCGTGCVSGPGSDEPSDAPDGAATENAPTVAVSGGSSDAATVAPGVGSGPDVLDAGAATFGAGGASSRGDAGRSSAGQGNDPGPGLDSGAPRGSGGTSTLDASPAAGGGQTVGPLPADCDASTAGYVTCGTARNFDDARALCESFGMLLIRIDSSDENQWYATTVPGGWLGGDDRAVAGEWRWQDGEQFWSGDENGSAVGGLFTAWESLNPSTTPPGTNCARMTVNATWNDLSCGFSSPFACERY